MGYKRKIRIYFKLIKIANKVFGNHCYKTYEMLETSAWSCSGK